jgi:hypothetical protein
MGELLNGADLTAQAYSRRKPRLPVIPETLGLAVVLIVNRNTSRDRALWLAHPEVHGVIGDLAEAFGGGLSGRPSPEGWRGGALASLRTLAGDTLHEVAEPWPWHQAGEPRMVGRFWVDDPLTYDYTRPRGQWRVPSPLRVALLRRLAREPRIEEAWQAMLDVWEHGSWGRPGRTREIHVRGVLASWDNAHERPEDTKWLHSQLLGGDPQADLEARYREALAASGRADG